MGNPGERNPDGGRSTPQRVPFVRAKFGITFPRDFVFPASIPMSLITVCWDFLRETPNPVTVYSSVSELFLFLLQGRRDCTKGNV